MGIFRRINSNQKNKDEVDWLYRISIGLLFLFVVFAITNLLKVDNKFTEVGENKELVELRNRALKESDQLERLKQDLHHKQKEIEKYTDGISKFDKKTEKVKSEINENNVKLGNTEIYGKGIVITLKDGEDKNKLGTEALPLIVHDTDVLEIVNMLRNAGAEAISVNDQRIVGNTPISCIGTVIKVNNEKLGGPYVIKAIGNPEQLESAANLPGGVLKIITSYGVQASVEKKENIKVPKYNGVYSMEHIREIN